MQQVSKAYKEAMKSPIRNRGYIRVRIGVINSQAQENVRADEQQNQFAYFSMPDKAFQGYAVDKVYATAEQNFSRVDGSMYFLPAAREDVFNGTSYFKITLREMMNGQGRLRIYQFTCGITNIFTNMEVMNYSMKDFVSPISETIPSQDMTLTVDNQNLYYSVNNPESARAYMEVGQEVKTAFGYDLTGEGEIEWGKENTTYLKSWSADRQVERH